MAVLMHAFAGMRVNADNNESDEVWRDDTLLRIGRQGKYEIANPTVAAGQSTVQSPRPPHLSRAKIVQCRLARLRQQGMLA